MTTPALLTETELSTIKENNYRFIFCIGPPCSGKESQVEKISNEFKYSKLSLNSLIEMEITSDSELGKILKEYQSNSEIIKPEHVTSVLVRGILQIPKNSTILIDGFPLNLDDALYFEQNITQIELILKFNGNEETLTKNLQENPENYPNIKIEDLPKLIENSNKDLKKIEDFYSSYSIVRNIDINNKTSGEINSIAKQCLYPNIYSIIGKRYSGKTELSNVIHIRTGITLIDFNQFLKREDISKRLNDNEFVVTSFINYLRKMRELRVLVEDFPQNKEQYIYFVNNCKEFEKIIFLQADNSTCLERLNKIPLNDKNYIKSSELNKLLYEFEQKKDFFDFLKKKAKFDEVNVNNHKILIVKRMVKQLQPYCAFIETQGDSNAKEELFSKLHEKYGYKEISLVKIIEKAILRKIIEKNENNDYSLEQKIKLIRPILYSEGNKKLILNTFPTDMNELTAFEENLCYISKYIVLSENHTLNKINNVDSMAVYCCKNNILTTLNPKNLMDYKIEECLDMTKDVNIVYGLPNSGKTTIARHLKTKYNYELLDFKELIEKVKKTKVDPENPDAEPEINFTDLVNYLKEYITNLTLNKKVVIDNIFIPGGADGFLIDSLEKATEIINIIGNFRNLYEIDVPEKVLMDKYKAKEGITEEITDEQKVAFEETLEIPKKLLDVIKKVSANNIKVKCEEPAEKSIKLFDSQYNVNIIILKHEYDICLEKSLSLFCARNRVLYVNVPKLIYNHFYENDEEAKKLESAYGKKKLLETCKDENNFDELVFYKYNPINFERDLVLQLIGNYIVKNSKTIEESGNFVLLSGYLNYDLLENKDEPYNLPLLELKNILELGELTSFIQLTRKDIKLEEDEKAVQEIVEKKPKVKKEGEEGEEQQPEEPPAEEEVNKFKPEDFAWTSYDGVPRNYVQILKRLKNFPVKIIEASDTCREELIKALGNHLDNFMNKDELKYRGVITIIKINGDVPKETIEAVNKVSKFVEGRREADGMKNRSKDKNKAGAIYEVL